uniref:ATP synthase complex subunit 8 n=1 Tax=Coccinellidae sp. 1 EF-2015 TaxID=1756852 RepID=A0A0S2M6Y8_9CUCU|nr:ATP synthase F0 subunit 8 [Coccinellidae sp. 1 EF-2015]
MPQMMPLNWLNLMIYFIFIFFLFNISLYFNYLLSNKTQLKSSYKISKNWKW